MKHTPAIAVLLALCFIFVPTALSSFGPITDLGNLGGIGSNIIGGAAGDEAGFSVAVLPDVNGDQIADMLIGAPYANGTGVAYLVYGKVGFTSGGDLDLSALGAGGVVINGEAADDNLGWAVASLGDLNGDNLTDFIISAPGHDAGGEAAGRCYLIYGQSNFPQNLDLSTLGSGGVIIDGAGDLNLIGYSLAAAGDFGGTPDPDIIIGAPLVDTTGGTAAGAAYVIHWDSSIPQQIDLASLGSRGTMFTGGQFIGNAGFSVSGDFDFNGDGSADVMIGVPGAAYGASYLGGRAYVIYGRSGFTSPVDLAAAPGNGYGASFDGASDFEETGYAVLGLEDFNEDGFGDAVITAPLASPGGTESGRTYLIYGSSSPQASTDLAALGAAGITFNGETAGEGKLGLTLARAGDINGDGIDDFAIGAPAGSTAGGMYAGITRLLIGNRFYGSAEQLGSLPRKESVFKGAQVGDFSGNSIAGGGDIDNDGEMDLLIGSFGYTTGSEAKKGLVHFVQGQDLGSIVWPHSAPTTGVGTLGQNMSYVPYLDVWGDFTSGSSLGLTIGLQVDTAWSQQTFPVFYGLLIVGFNVFNNGAKLNNATVWPFINNLSLLVNFPVFSDTGSWVQDGKVPAGVPTGVRIYMQQLWKNPSNPSNLAATNATCITVK